ncbi:MAG TPA: DNA translocase FtsK 4TM domain-containing protein, partial [Chitinophagaceae bacterium]|nr:DNA translocase FtsK 4TM domain-containing protein [Chitinophagaceae bacterium]
MANKLKKTAGKKAKADPKKADTKAFKQEKEENIDWKKLARDERTWKITGTLFLLIAAFLLIAFISYFFTWKEDQDKVFRGGSALLMDNDIKVSNLLGRLGALVSHFFIYKGFGIASLLICTFFFVVGTNLLLNRKVFSIWRNLKYVTIGLLVLSVSLAFVLAGNDFPFGGGAGAMISKWLIGIFGTVGTAAILLVVAFAYFIWQFNPTFKVSGEKQVSVSGEQEANDPADNSQSVLAGKTINEKYAEAGMGNSLKGGAGMIDLTINDAAKLHDLKMVEKDDPTRESLERDELSIENEMVSDMLHKYEELRPGTTEQSKKDSDTRAGKKTPGNTPGIDLELEINTPPLNEEDETETDKRIADLPPYEPTLDLKNYKYPGLDLLETHGSEKIIQDPAELENNKNQIIATLRNYSIEIQKISATVGATVTLYEIVPSAGVRISRIKNLEDDIALSLSALGIRIIAPIPGKGTIGIEVPNAKKTIVSMRTLLESDKFKQNNFS